MTCEASLDQSKKQASSSNSQDVQLRALEREAKAQRDLLEAYLAKYREATARENIEAALTDGRIISRATRLQHAGLSEEAADRADRDAGDAAAVVGHHRHRRAAADLRAGRGWPCLCTGWLRWPRHREPVMESADDGEPVPNLSPDLDVPLAAETCANA